jgi:hypothetical protein
MARRLWGDQRPKGLARLRLVADLNQRQIGVSRCNSEMDSRAN